MNTKFTKLFLCVALCLAVVPGTHAAGLRGLESKVGAFEPKPEGSFCTYTKDCQGNLECYAAEMWGPIRVSRCQKSGGRRLEAVGAFDKKPEGSFCTYTKDCQGDLKCYAAEMWGPIRISRCQK